MIVRERFTWKGLKGDVLRYVQECEACQSNKRELTHPVELLQPLHILEGKWESISMDFITGLLMVQGRDCIYVVVDRLTKYAHFFAIPTRYSTSQVAELFFKKVFCLHGLPRTTVSDRDNRFMGGILVGAFQKGDKKLQPRFYVPYKVTRRLGEVAYELELPLGSKIHHVFHVSCLKKVLGQQVTTTTELPPLDDEAHLGLELEAILEIKERKLRRKTIREYLVC
eukprot:PITA_32187